MSVAAHESPLSNRLDWAVLTEWLVRGTERQTGIGNVAIMAVRTRSSATAKKCGTPAAPLFGVPHAVPKRVKCAVSGAAQHLLLHRHKLFCRRWVNPDGLVELLLGEPGDDGDADPLNDLGCIGADHVRTNHFL